MRLQALVYFYCRRLRTHPVQELLAGTGIAIGVALAFAVTVANGSIVGSAGEVLRGVTGSADLQLSSRDGRGFDEDLLVEVRGLPGVRNAAPLLEHRAVLVGPTGTEVPVTLASIDPSLAQLSGALTRSFVPGGFQLGRGAMLPMSVVDALGLTNPRPEGQAQPLPTITAEVRGRSRQITVAAALGRDTVGSLTDARLAIMPLDYLQQLAGQRGRLTRVLIESEPGREAEVRDGLAKIAGGRLAVVPADHDIDLLEQATGPTDQVTGFFAAISALLGFLLAFNAMLLTAPERRRLVGSLRIQGFRPRQVVLLVLFQAAVLGIVASIVGVIVGAVLSREVFDETPAYLSSGFTIGTRTIIGSTPLLLGLVGGIAASCLAAAPPLLDLRRGRAVDAVLRARGSPGHAVTRSATGRMLAVAVTMFLMAAALLIWAPSAALVASGMLAVATLLTIPATFAGALRGVELLARRLPRVSTLTVALLAMRATTLRSLALAGTGAIAVFGSIAIGGARDDLLRGIANYADDYVSTADIWIVNPGDNQATNEFEVGGLARQVRELGAVADVRAYRGGFLDVDGRRVWVIARPRGDPAMLPASQMVDGDLSVATRRLRAGGWIALSEAVAEDRGASLGDRVALPTPAGVVVYRLAATTTNLGWAPGALILNSLDYRRDWDRHAVTALEVDLERGADLGLARAAIENVAGPDSGLRVQTAHEHSSQMNDSVRQGLRRLGQISLLLLIAAVLAMATAMGAAIWQRRPALAALRMQSFGPRQLWLLLLLEAGLILGVGGLTGALGGIYGQFGADRYLALVTGFPVAPMPAGLKTIETLVLVVSAALAIVAVPGWFASRAPLRLGLGGE